MTTRTIEQLDAEIEKTRAIARATLARLNQKKILAETLNACKNDEERSAVKNIGPRFIDQYFTVLEKFTADCACTDGVGFPTGALHEILQSVGVRTKGYYIPNEEEKVLNRIIGGRPPNPSWCCYRRNELVRLYCLVKSDPAILERTREQLGQQELVS